MGTNIMKHVCGFLCALMLCLAFSVPALAETAGHSAAEDRGTAPTVGAQTPFDYDGVHYSGATEFYLRIQNPRAPANHKGKSLPKTGDRGARAEVLLSAALLCGGAYLICCAYEKKHE